MAEGIERIVIAGAGQAGATVAMGLRRAGFSGDITMVGEETHLPYERPQLSKEMLRPEHPPHRSIKVRSDYEAQNIKLALGRRVIHADAAGRRLKLDDGRDLPYDRLVIATGVTPRRLPGLIEAPDQLHYLRTVEDAARLRADIECGKHLAIVGGGVIGLEVAAAARARACQVTLIEAGDRLMARSVDETVSAYLDRSHRANGVSIRYGVYPVAQSRDGQLKLSDGSVIDAQSVLVGIGVVPNIGGFEHLGITDALGVRVDANGQSLIPGIYATGDIASQPFDGSYCRIETWANAQDHAAAVAKNLLGATEPNPAPVWFWSDQGPLNLQVVGNAQRGLSVVRGDSQGEVFSVFRLDHENRVSGCSCVNSPKDMALARRWVKQGTQVDPKRLADPGVPLRDCVA